MLCFAFLTYTRTVFMICAPQHRPSYSPDASLESAYNLVNKAWNSVYRNSSALQGMCVHLPALTAAGANTTQFGCPKCIADMRLISFTGGK